MFASDLLSIQPNWYSWERVRRKEDNSIPLQVAFHVEETKLLENKDLLVYDYAI